MVVDVPFDDEVARERRGVVEVAWRPPQREGHQALVESTLSNGGVAQRLRIELEVAHGLGFRPRGEPVEAFRYVASGRRVAGVLVRLSQNGTPEPAHKLLAVGT